jgi:hypothetical protein
MKITGLVVAVLAVASGLAGVATAAIYAIPAANAVSCQTQFNHFVCHGCAEKAPDNTAFRASNGKCLHLG